MALTVVQAEAAEAAEGTVAAEAAEEIQTLAAVMAEVVVVALPITTPVTSRAPHQHKQAEIQAPDQLCFRILQQPCQVLQVHKLLQQTQQPQFLTR